jgi:hypothetical protein
MAKQTKATLKTGKPQPGTTLHQWIASGGDPADYERCKGVNQDTIPNIKK